jgi:hypothetical protein
MMVPRPPALLVASAWTRKLDFETRQRDRPDPGRGALGEVRFAMDEQPRWMKLLELARALFVTVVGVGLCVTLPKPWWVTSLLVLTTALAAIASWALARQLRAEAPENNGDAPRGARRLTR